MLFSWSGGTPDLKLELRRLRSITMIAVFNDFKHGLDCGSVRQLASSLNPIPPADHPDRLREFYHIAHVSSIEPGIRYCLFYETNVRLSRNEQTAWVDIYTAFWFAAGELIKFDDPRHKGDWVTVFDAWKGLANVLIKNYSNGCLKAWMLPCLYIVGKYLRVFAIKADMQVETQGSGDVGAFDDDIGSEFTTSAKLEDAARTINRMFILCLSDRAPLEESRKWGIYHMTNLMFKTYFKLKSIGLCKNLLRALDASSADLPPLSVFPKSDAVTFNYYVGLIHFLDENYAEAEEHLRDAWYMCTQKAPKNQELILTYLIPCFLVNTHKFPSPELLERFPRLEALFCPLCNCIRKGDLVGFDAALAAGEDQFIQKRIYLTLERGRNIAVRNLFRKVFLAGGYDEPKDVQTPIRRTRIPVAEFAAALRIGTNVDERTPLDIDQAECLLANLIYKGLMKGYIARDRGMVVLSKGGTAFPGTGV